MEGDHLGFKQACTVDPCVGHWAVHIDEGRYGDVALDGANAFVMTEAPRLMISGNWTQRLHLDERAGTPQRDALQTIIAGKAGGPWAVLAPFVATRLPTRYARLMFRDDGHSKRMWVDGGWETTVEAIRGADRSREAVLETVFNQIHAPTQVFAHGTTRYTDERFTLMTSGTHALDSRCSWRGP